MADFCWQCTETIIGLPGEKNDLKGLSDESDTKNGLYHPVICEGCGMIQVDHKGRCVSIDCLENHNKEGNKDE